MIEFIEPCKSEPYKKLSEFYKQASKKKQINIEAINISSYSKALNEVNSRYVNLKYVMNKEFIFFSNYESPKSNEFTEHNQMSAAIYWNSINVQIRMKAMIKRTSKSFNNKYFKNRSKDKNALAISSNQSNVVDSYESILKNYQHSLEFDNLNKCPSYWGGYSFIPYYFEFWEGHKFRINKRNSYTKKNSKWIQSILQP